jgi:hypothetical protein
MQPMLLFIAPLISALLLCLLYSPAMASIALLLQFLSAQLKTLFVALFSSLLVPLPLFSSLLVRLVVGICKCHFHIELLSKGSYSSPYGMYGGPQ